MMRSLQRSPGYVVLVLVTLSLSTVLGAPVYDLLDFWHLLEKLAPAAQVLYGEAEGKTVLG